MGLLNYNPNLGKVNLSSGSGGETENTQQMSELQCLREGGVWDPISGTCRVAEEEAITTEQAAPLTAQGRMDLLATDPLASNYYDEFRDLYEVNAARAERDPYGVTVGTPITLEAIEATGPETWLPQASIDAQKRREKVLEAITSLIPIAGSFVKAAQMLKEKVKYRATPAEIAEVDAIVAEKLSTNLADPGNAAFTEKFNRDSANAASNPYGQTTGNSVNVTSKNISSYLPPVVSSSNNDDSGPSHSEIISQHNAIREAASKLQKADTGASFRAADNDRGWIGGFNKGGLIMRNKGGNVPVYANDGMLMNHPFDREGEQFDTVDAKLTPGEFVIDADSTHVFQPILEEINKWEPGDDVKLGGLLSKKGEKMTITKDLGNGRKMSVTSGENDEMMSEDAMAMLSTETKPGMLMSKMPKEDDTQYLNVGGLLDNPRRNARLARNAQRRGAALSGGLSSLGKNLDNTTAQVGSAGFRTNSLGSWGSNGYQGANFSSRNAPATNFGQQLYPIGQAQQEIANADAAYMDELTSIKEGEDAIIREDAIRAEDRANQLADEERNRSYQVEDRDIRRRDEMAEREHKEDELAAKENKSKAEDIRTMQNIANDIVSTMKAVNNARPAFEAYKNAQFTANKVFAAGSLIPSVNASALNQSRERAIEEYMLKQVDGGGISQEAYNSWKEMDQQIKRLAQLILNTQTGTKTDFDFKVAAAQIADTSGNPESILHNLSVTLKDANRSIKQLGGTPVQSPSLQGASNISQPSVGADDRSAGPRDLSADLGIGQGSNQQSALGLQTQNAYNTAVDVGSEALDTAVDAGSNLVEEGKKLWGNLLGGN